MVENPQIVGPIVGYDVVQHATNRRASDVERSRTSTVSSRESSRRSSRQDGGSTKPSEIELAGEDSNEIELPRLTESDIGNVLNALALNALDYALLSETELAAVA